MSMSPPSVPGRLNDSGVLNPCSIDAVGNNVNFLAYDLARRIVEIDAQLDAIRSLAAAVAHNTQAPAGQALGPSVAPPSGLRYLGTSGFLNPIDMNTLFNMVTGGYSEVAWRLSELSDHLNALGAAISGINAVTNPAFKLIQASHALSKFPIR